MSIIIFCPKNLYGANLASNVIFVDFLVKKSYLAIMPSKICQSCLSISCPKKTFSEHFCANYSHFSHFLVKKWESGNLFSKIWEPIWSMAFKNGTNNFIVPKNLNVQISVTITHFEKILVKKIVIWHHCQADSSVGYRYLFQVSILFDTSFRYQIRVSILFDTWPRYPF